MHKEFFGYKSYGLQTSEGDIEPFVTLTSEGIKKEGRPYPGEGFDTAYEAFLSYEECLDEYLMEGHLVYWRETPDIFKNDEGRWRVFSRLIASSIELYELSPEKPNATNQA